MYNSIYPININYSNHAQHKKNDDKNQNVANGADRDFSSDNSQNTFPNGTKVAIDYTKGQINISQVLTDFRSTIVAINAPEEVKEEVNLYLGLVEKETKKERPFTKKQSNIRITFVYINPFKKHNLKYCSNKFSNE